MSSGRTRASNSSPLNTPSLTAASLKLMCSWCAVWATLAALSYPIFGDSAVTSINEFFTYLSTCSVHFNPLHAVLDKAVAHVGQQLHRMQIIEDDHRLEHVQLEISLRAGKPNR